RRVGRQLEVSLVVVVGVAGPSRAHVALAQELGGGRQARAEALGLLAARTGLQDLTLAQQLVGLREHLGRLARGRRGRGGRRRRGRSRLGRDQSRRGGRRGRRRGGGGGPRAPRPRARSRARGPPVAARSRPAGPASWPGAGAEAAWRAPPPARPPPP